MGQLKPGATYIYERQGGTIYAREHGASADTRVAIGWDWEPESNPARVRGVDQAKGSRDLEDHNEWIKIRLAGRTNPSLQQAIDRVKLLYKLSQEKYE
jgi:hypothetical protein